MPSRSTRTTGIVLAIVGLVAVVVAIVLLVRPGGGATAPGGMPGTSPSASSSAPAAEDGSTPAATSVADPPAPSADAPADPSAAPAPEDPAPAADAPAPAAALAVDAFSASPSTVSCEGDRTADRPVSLSWSTSGGTAARLATGTTGTAAGDPVELAASGYGLTVACRDSETLVALTVEAADGSTVQRTLVITAED